MTQILVFLIETLGHLWLFAVLLRFFAQATRTPFRAKSGNPLADFVMALTDWAVMPVRRLVPALFGLDTGSFVVAWLGSAILTVILLLVVSGGAVSFAASPTFVPGLMVVALVLVLRLTLYLYIGLLIVQAVLSWVSPYHPMRGFFDVLVRPLLRPIQKLVPLIGGVDLSPLFAILLLQVILIGPLPWLSGHASLLMLGRGL